jgi:hypothetical protein
VPERLSNRDIAELLALDAERAEGHRARAGRRASRAAPLWPAEAADLVEAGGDLTELRAIGPSLPAAFRIG